MPKASQGGSGTFIRFFTHFRGKNTIRCHPCYLVVTRNILIFRKCCKVATVARVKNFMYARVRARRILIFLSNNTSNLSCLP